jgi:hypothetical protein
MNDLVSGVGDIVRFVAHSFFMLPASAGSDYCRTFGYLIGRYDAHIVKARGQAKNNSIELTLSFSDSDQAGSFFADAQTHLSAYLTNSHLIVQPDRRVIKWTAFPRCGEPHALLGYTSLVSGRDIR